MLRPSLQRSLAAIAVVALASGCGKSDQAEASAKAAGARAVAAPAAAPAPAAQPPLDDGTVLARLDADNAADSNAGALAVAKGTSASVKDFGRMMMKDHHAMRVEDAALASKAGITPVTPPGNTEATADAALADSMTALPRGAAWDKFFVDHQVAGHTKVLQFAQDAANRTQNADLKAMIQKSAPRVEKHLDKAKAIQGALGTATARAPM